MSTYKSKIGLEIIIPISIVLLSTGYLSVYDQKWVGLVIIMLVTAFITHMLLTTCYQVDGQNLVIKSGFLFKKSVKIDSIKKIKATNNPLSSPAASLDRLAIFYNQFDSIMISPKDKTGFINALTNINPGIEIILKKKNK